MNENKYETKPSIFEWLILIIGFLVGWPVFLGIYISDYKNKDYPALIGGLVTIPYVIFLSLMIEKVLQ